MTTRRGRRTGGRRGFGLALAGLLGPALAALLGACGFQALLHLELSFQPLGGVPLDCETAGVETVIVSLYEAADAPPVSRITRSCRAWRHQELLVDPGTLTVRVEGLNADGAVCYQDTQRLSFERRDDHFVDWTVIETGEGRANGCTYPETP